MRNTPRRCLAVVVAAAQFFSAVPGRSAVIPTIYAPAAKVVVKKPYRKQPSCPNGGTDPLSGQRSEPPPDLPLTPNSPGVAVAPWFNSGNGALTVWGLGWSSESDQTMTLSADGTAAWMNGSGSTLNFFRVAGSTAPAYRAPIASYVTLTAVVVAGGTPTALSERDGDGTTRLFSVFESTSVLRLSKLADRNGNTIVYTRDGQGRLTHVQDVHGRTFDVAYDNAGYAAKLTDSGGRTVTFSHDTAGHMTSQTGTIGTTSYQYDAGNRMTQITYPNGGVRDYVYDAQGRVTHEDDGAGQNARDYVYYKSSTTVTDALGRVTKYEYVSAQGYKKPSRVTDASGGVTQYAYDANYALAAEVDALGRTTQYVTDAKGNVLQVTNAAGGRTSTNFDPLYSLPTLRTDPLNRQTVLSYDSLGNLIREQDPMGGVTRMSYDAIGHVTASQDPLTHSTNYTYQSNNGALASITDPLSHTTSLNTDALSRVTQNTDPDSKVTKYQYDVAGDLTKVTDALNHDTNYAYVAGREKKLLGAVTDANGHTTTFGYDAQGRVTSVTDALSHAKYTYYDAAGNIDHIVNARGQTISYQYDSLNRRTRQTSPEGQINYSYDAAGNATQITHYNGSSIQNTYDALNRLTQQIQTLPNGYSATIGYAYDAAGNRTSMTTPWGSFSYQYDANNRLTKITNPQNKIFTFSYDAAGRRTQMMQPNGITTVYSYDNANRITSIVATRNSDSAVVSSVAYTYDAAGNRTSMTDWEGTHNYTYDDLHRLTQAQHPATTVLLVQDEKFSYDSVGNRLADARISGYTYNQANELTANSSFTYTYDADGNLTAKAVSESTTTYTYSSRNQLATVLLPDSTVWSYKYDARGRRVEKSSGTSMGQSTRYIYDRFNLLAILDSANNPIVIIDQDLAIDRPLLLHDASGNDYAVHSDALESVLAYTDTLGHISERAVYQVYGSPQFIDFRSAPTVESRSFTFNSLSFTSREWDSELGIYFYRGRQTYDPLTGRFEQQDPMEHMGSSNLYAYVINNPTNYKDPFGTQAVQGPFPRTPLIPEPTPNFPDPQKIPDHRRKHGGSGGPGTPRPPVCTTGTGGGGGGDGPFGCVLESQTPIPGTPYDYCFYICTLRILDVEIPVPGPPLIVPRGEQCDVLLGD